MWHGKINKNEEVKKQRVTGNQECQWQGPETSRPVTTNGAKQRAGERRQGQCPSGGITHVPNLNDCHHISHFIRVGILA